MKVKFITINIIVALLLLLGSLPVIAANATSNSTQGIGCGGGFGPLADFLCDLSGKPPGTTNTTVEVGGKFNKAMSGIIGFMTIIAGLWFIIQFITAGIQWLGAGGDKNSLEQARNKIVNSIIGLIIIVSAWVIVGIIGGMLGLNILNPGAALNLIGL